MFFGQVLVQTPLGLECLQLDPSEWTPTVANLKRRMVPHPGFDECFYVVSDGKSVVDEDFLIPGKEYAFRCRFVGGKGGFGSLLRSFGSQISKNRNQDACRDLSGRRLRNVKTEERMKKMVEKQAAKEAEKKKKKEEKIKKLKEALESKPKHNFADPVYETERAQIPEKVFNAVEEGLKVVGSVTATTSTVTVTTSSVDGASPSSSSAGPSTSTDGGVKRKHVDPIMADVKSKRMKGWLGVGDSDDSEEETK